MSEPAPFAFKAAKPVGKHPVQVAEEMNEADEKQPPLDDPALSTEGDDLTVFLEIVNRLQAFSPVMRKRVMTALQGLFP